MSAATLASEAGVAAVVERLCRRQSSAFGRRGPDEARALVERAAAALEQDLSAGARDSARAIAYAVVEGYTEHGLTFSDLRLFCQTLRKHARVAHPSAEARVELEAWFYDLLMVGSMRFMAWRDEKIQRETAARELERFNSQLAELSEALAEKSELLEVIRQSSTPIAPVVPGILVVPLVGTFDTTRARLLTEKLLDAIIHHQARATILDASGVPVFDLETTHLIVRLAHAAKLLGTTILLVGLSAQTARSIVMLELDLHGLKTLANLREGLAHALRLQELAIASIADLKSSA